MRKHRKFPLKHCGEANRHQVITDPRRINGDGILSLNEEGEHPLSTEHMRSQISRLLLGSSFTALCFLLSACELFVGSNVLKAPTITLTADPTSIALGQTATLTVVATQATQVTITGSDGLTYNLGTTGGTQLVKPAATTTYTATATNSKGSAAATAIVTVSIVQPTVNITATPSTITSGSSSTLTVTATNATQVTVTGTDGSSYTLQPTGGTRPSVQPRPQHTPRRRPTPGVVKRRPQRSYG